MDKLIPKWIEDINNAILEIESFFENRPKKFEIFENDTMLRKAIMMNITIIGEAMNRILKVYPDIKISSARKIVNTRNYVIHGYDSLQNDILWGIVIRHLPLLKKELQSLTFPKPENENKNIN